MQLPKAYFITDPQLPLAIAVYHKNLFSDPLEGYEHTLSNYDTDNNDT